MKKYIKEIVILFIQLLIFYLCPIFINEPFGLVLVIATLTFVLSSILASISNNKMKYFYPIITSILFIPSVFIYYNESALIHSIWYLIVSIIGIIFGILMYKLKG